ncbi:PREDICTED: glutathione S-transferase 1-1-like [Ceratosolen solmsi marchali]|uniref:Glutathione S-transferase 1-1-like n=1 Tax=Ceratosolen solmsi marchali TaxID=326594 RepID=A0AAJ6YFZ5_9HYME|nr:PREDICTED: glutathione S-transferase 1-1-like [Ceratosolen solmsi marchali]
MTIDLYYFPLSVPCRSVMILAKYLGIHLNLKQVNLFKGEQMQASFKKINPQHTLPTIDDNGFILWESRPIMIYLVMKYAKNDSLYPRDPEKRAIVEHRLYFDIGTLFENIIDCYRPVLIGISDTPSEKYTALIEKAFELLDGYLKDSRFVAGNELTIADFAIGSSVSAAKAFTFDIGRYDNVVTWYEYCERVMEKCGFKDTYKTIGDFYSAQNHKNSNT